MIDRYAFAHWLSVDPPVLVTFNWFPRQAPPAADTEITHIAVTGRAMTRSQLVSHHQTLSQIIPKWRHIVGTSDELVVYDRSDPRLMFFHDHLIVSPQFWQIQPCEKYYDAVMQAAAVPWKRHWLAAEVDRLLLIAYAHDRTDPRLLSYLEHLKTTCPKAMWASPAGEFIDSDSLSGFINQARCGLILSAAEGGCRAVAEYLLCGIPVVTTTHTGGRMGFVNPSHMQIVPAEEKMIAAAVSEFVMARLDPHVIRNTFIRRHAAGRLQVEKDLGLVLQWPEIPILPYANMFDMEVPRAS